MLDYRIETFITLCKTLNYRMAAKELNITQPAVTQHIKYLEEYYGCRLFLYNNRKLSVTPQGEILLHYVYSQNYQEQKLVEEIKEKKGHHFAIGTTKTIGEYVIMGQVKKFLQEPENSITVETDNTEKILELLNQGKIDFALVEGFFDRNIYAHRLYKMEPFVGFCSINHPFAGRTVSQEELLGETVIVRENGSGTRNILEKNLQANNRILNDFRRVVSIGNFSLLEALVSENAGVTFAYRVVGSNNPMLAEFSVSGWSMEREFNYVYLPNTDGERFVEIFENYTHQ